MADEHRVPDFKLLVDGAAAPPDLQASVIGIRVTDDMDRSSRFWVHLSDIDRKWTRQNKFKPGTAVEIKLGYRDGGASFKTVMKGEVSSLEVILTTEGPSRLVVSGVDKGHAFDKGTLTKTYQNVKDSDLAAQIAQRHGLSAQVDDSQLVHEYVIQNNLSDYDFLMQRAAIAGFRVYVDDQKLLFKKAKVGDPPAATLTWRENIGRFVQEVNTFDQVSKITAAGWDPKQMKEITGPAKKGDEYGTQGGTITGAKLVKQMYGDIEAVVPISSGEKAHLEAVAKSEYNRRAGTFVHAEARVTGDPAIRAGSVVEVRKAGKRVDGEYYVVSTDHLFFVDSGYATEFRAKRYTIQKGNAPASTAGKSAKAAAETAKKEQEAAEKIKAASKWELKAAREAAKKAEQAVEAAKQSHDGSKQALDDVKNGNPEVAQAALRPVESHLATLPDYVAAARSETDEAEKEASNATQDDARQALSKAHEAADRASAIASEATQHARDSHDAVLAAALDGEHTQGGELSPAVQAHKKSALANAQAAIAAGQAGLTQAKAAIAQGKSAIEMCAASAVASAGAQIDKLGGQLGNVADAVKKSGDAAAKSIGSALAAAAQHVVDAAKAAIEEAQRAAEDAKKAVENAADDIRKAVGDQLEGVIDGARDVVEGVKKAIAETKKQLDEAKKHVDEALDQYSGKWIKAGAFIGEHAKKSYDAGQSLYAHLDEGLSPLREKKWADAARKVEPAKSDFASCKSEAQLCSDKLREVEEELPAPVKETLRKVVDRVQAILPGADTALSRFREAVEAKDPKATGEAQRASEQGKATQAANAEAHERDKDQHEAQTKGFVQAAKEHNEKLQAAGGKMHGALEDTAKKSGVAVDKSADTQMAQARGAMDLVRAACGAAQKAFEEAQGHRAALSQLVGHVPGLRVHVDAAGGHLETAHGEGRKAADRSQSTLKQHESAVDAEAEKIAAKLAQRVEKAQAALKKAKERLERSGALFRSMPKRPGASESAEAASSSARSATGAAGHATASSEEAHATARGVCKVPDDASVKSAALAAIGALEKAIRKAMETAEHAQKAVDAAGKGDAAGAKSEAGAAESSQAETAQASGTASASAKRSQTTAAASAGRKEPPKETAPKQDAPASKKAPESQTTTAKPAPVDPPAASPSAAAADTPPAAQPSREPETPAAVQPATTPPLAAAPAAAVPDPAAVVTPSSGGGILDPSLVSDAAGVISKADSVAKGVDSAEKGVDKAKDFFKSPGDAKDKLPSVEDAVPGDSASMLDPANSAPALPSGGAVETPSIEDLLPLKADDAKGAAKTAAGHTKQGEKAADAMSKEEDAEDLFSRAKRAVDSAGDDK